MICIKLPLLPISNPGIFSYKYRLVDKYEENGKIISKIKKIIPRKTSTSTLAGYIYVIDSLWLVNKIELSLKKGNLLVYDYFNIYKNLKLQGIASVCLSNKTLVMESSIHRSFPMEEQSIATFSNYNFNPQFGRRFFGTELAVTEQEAYEKETPAIGPKKEGLF